MTANLHGVWAKWDRATEQLQALDYEVRLFGRQTHAWAIVSQVHRDGSQYLFRLYPRWDPGLVYLWGTILGEIVHNLRSALDQFIWQLVVLNSGKPDRQHSFPFLLKEPDEGFGVYTRRQWTDSRRKFRHGPLFGLSDEAVALIETYQPYQGGHAALLHVLHHLWNTDKHQQLIPTALTGTRPTIHVTNGNLTDREDRLEGDTYVVEATVAPNQSGLEPQVDVEPHPPTDILLSNGGPGPPIIQALKHTAQQILTNVLIPAAEMFPGESGIGLPAPTRLAPNYDHTRAVILDP